MVATEERIRVRYGETDAMGHVYYANYLYYMEQARGAWCRDRGFTYKCLEDRGFFLPVVEVHLRYKAEIKYDEEITIRVNAPEIKRASIRFDYSIFREDGALASEGYSWHVFMGAARKAISIPPEIRTMMETDPI